MFVADCVRLSSFAFCGGLSNSNVVSKTAGTKTEFDIKQPFKVISFILQSLQAGNGLLIAVIIVPLSPKFPKN